MKIFKIFAFLVVTLSFSACETYGDPDVKDAGILPMAGDWVVTVRDVQPDTLIAFAFNKAGKKTEETVISTFNTASMSTSEMWLEIASTSTNAVNFKMKGKVDLNLGARTFSKKDGQNIDVETNTLFQLTEGKVVVKGMMTPSNREKEDAIYFTIETAKAPGRIYKIEGYRRTHWEDDEPQPRN